MNNIQKPEIQVHFVHPQKRHNNQQHWEKLSIEMLRLVAADRRATIGQVLNMSKHELSQFFVTYQSFPSAHLPSLKESSSLKLIRNNGRIYFGQVINRQMSGPGVCFYAEGKIYEGNFVANRKQGEGCEIYSNGNLYLGQFLKNKKHGWGKFFWFNLVDRTMNEDYIEFYEGQWWGGLPDGKGVIQKINGSFRVIAGDKYQGTFKNGLKHGFGREQFGNGDHYKGQYANGLPEGIGQYQWADGSFYKGDFKQGLRNGYGYWKLNETETADRYSGNYSMDRKSGYGEYTWQNGWIYKGNFENDYREGYGELFSRDQCVYKGQWKKGSKVQSCSVNKKLKFSHHSLKSQSASKQQQIETKYIDWANFNNQEGNEKIIQHKLLQRPGSMVRTIQPVCKQKEERKMQKNHQKESGSRLWSRMDINTAANIERAGRWTNNMRHNFN